MRNIYIYTTIPYFYFIKTRLAGIFQKISWVIIYFFPAFIIYYFLSKDNSISIQNFFVYLLSITAINYVYENGYIQNDVFTSRKEKKPTKRLSENDCEEIFNNSLVIFSIRLLIFAFIIYLISRYGGSYNLYFSLFSCIFLQLIYLLYNNIRSIANLFLIIPLSYIRFYLPILSISPEYLNLDLLLILLLIYPIPKFIEFSKQKKYSLTRISEMIGSIDLFRFKYYLIMVAVSAIYHINKKTTTSEVFLIISIYFFLYRSISYLIIRKNQYLKEKVLLGAKKEYRD